MAETSGGTVKDDYTTRNEKYNNLIGKVEALELQIEARPMPKNKIADKIINKVNDRLKQKGGTNFISAAETDPSATALKNVLANITKMKETDKLQDL